MRTKRSRPASIFKSGHLDANHAEIVAALSRMGPEPVDTTRIGAGFPDLVWPFQGQTILIEVKRADGKLSPAQERFHSEWRGGPLYVIQNAEDIPAMIAMIHRPTIRRPIRG